MACARVPPIISFIGKPDCGKTTLLEKLIPALIRRGVRVGVVKHHVHEFEMDTPGKDTWRLKRAGARTTVLASPGGLGLVTEVEADPPLTELAARYFTDCDLLLTEGYKRENMPKIEVYRRLAHPAPLAEPGETLIATVTDRPLGRDREFGFGDTEPLADFLVERLPAPAPCATKAGSGTVTLRVNGRPLPLNGFAETVLSRTVQAIVSTLKGGEEGGPIELSITFHERQGK